MTVEEAIEKRRAYRSLEPVDISLELIRDLAEKAKLSPSCFNQQPWRFVFVKDKEILSQVFDALSKGNEWARAASMVIAVFSKRELDCDIHGREYYLFDTGMAVAFLILRATELGLVAHPIAGYREDKVKKALNIPEDMKVITLIIVGKHSEEISPILSEEQRKNELHRPERLHLEKFAFIDLYEG